MVLPSKTGNATFARDCARLATPAGRQAGSGFTVLLKPGEIGNDFGFKC